MTPKQLTQLLSHAIPAGLPILITGAPGIGKSDIVAKAAEAAGADLILSHPAVADPTDAKGLPWAEPGAKEATFLPFGELAAASKATKPTVWFLDDLGQASPAVQCFPGDTPIQMADGVVSIKDVHVGDRILDAHGSIQRVDRIWEKQDTDLVEISAVGVLPIKSTHEHPFLVSSGRKRKYSKKTSGKYTVDSERFGDAQWKDASDVKAGDWIAVPVPKPTRTDRWLNIEVKGQTKREVLLTPEFAKLCGYYCGDGWYTQHKAVQSVGFALDDKYPEIQEDLKALLSSVLDTRVFTRQQQGCKRIQVHDPALGNFFSEHIGNRSENKRIPAFILYHSDLELLTAFLQGYLNTDGGALKSGGKLRGVQWGTVSRTLAYQLQLALTRYGTLAAIKLHCKQGQVFTLPNGKNGNCRNAYVIQCSDKRVLQALKEPFDPKRHVCWSYENDGKIWTRVKSVKSVKQTGKVYNLSVSVSETYTAHNIAVHNCSFMQLLLARRVNGHRLPDCVTFVAATNRRTDKAGVSGILEPVKSRFGSIVNLDPSLDDWCQWAYNNNVPPMLIAFLRFRPDLLSKFEATADLTNSPCPRTWANLGRVEALGLPAEIESAAFAGSVGEGAAVEYLGFRTVASQLQSIDSILLDPKRARVPKQPNQLYAISVGLAAKATTSNIGRVIQYCQRLFEEKHGEFAALIMRDSVRREPKIEYCQDYQNAAFTELGQLITGGVS